MRATLIAVITLFGCTGDRTQEVVNLGPCVRPDTVTVLPWTYAAPDSVLPLIQSLDSAIASAPDSALPRFLLDRGYARSSFSPERGSENAKYAEGKDSVYWYNEIGGDWLYIGWDFKELIRRFPSSALADEAAYALTKLRPGGECEGYVACYVSTGWSRVREYLLAHRDSPRADSAAARALGAFDAIDTTADLRVETEFNGPGDIRKFVVELDSVARLLKQPWRAWLLERAGLLWTLFGDAGRARAAFDAALEGDAPPAARACIAPRLARLVGATIPMEPAKAIHASRIELMWQPQTERVAVHRAMARDDDGTVVATLNAGIGTWTDTATAPGTRYWYRVAVTAGAQARSLTTSAETPTTDLRARGAAVSTTSGKLHVFGTLDNGFQQVFSITRDGAMERTDATSLGLEFGSSAIHAFDEYAGSVWLPDGNGVGVLSFPWTGTLVSPALRGRLRSGDTLLKLAEDYDARLVFSIDERAGVFAVDLGGGGSRVVTMDCLGGGDLCWRGYQTRIALTARERTQRSYSLSELSPGVTAEEIPDIRIDPRDSSAWVLLPRTGHRLLHVGADGTVRDSVPVAGFLADNGPAFGFDRTRSRVWVTRIGPDGDKCEARRRCTRELVRIDANSNPATVRVVASDTAMVYRIPWVIPDLAGGVWLVTDRDARRFDESGKMLVSVMFGAQR